MLVGRLANIFGCLLQHLRGQAMFSCFRLYGHALQNAQAIGLIGDRISEISLRKRSRVALNRSTHFFASLAADLRRIVRFNLLRVIYTKFFLDSLDHLEGCQSMQAFE
jgi:hypothetical protein